MMIRVLFKARDNGQEFPVYFDNAAEIPDAAQKLNAVVLEQRPSHELELMVEQIATLNQWRAARRYRS